MKRVRAAQRCRTRGRTERERARARPSANGSGGGGGGGRPKSDPGAPEPPAECQRPVARRPLSAPLLPPLLPPPPPARASTFLSLSAALMSSGVRCVRLQSCACASASWIVWRNRYSVSAAAAASASGVVRRPRLSATTAAELGSKNDDIAPRATPRDAETASKHTRAGAEAEGGRRRRGRAGAGAEGLESRAAATGEKRGGGGRRNASGPPPLAPDDLNVAPASPNPSTAPSPRPMTMTRQRLHTFLSSSKTVLTIERVREEFAFGARFASSVALACDRQQTASWRRGRFQSARESAR